MTFRQKDLITALAVEHHLTQEDLDSLTDDLDIGVPNGHWQDLDVSDASNFIEAIKEEL